MNPEAKKILEDTYVCNACKNEVRYDADVPSYRCGDPNHDCGNGRFVHVGEDCRRLMYVIGPMGYDHV